MSGLDVFFVILSIVSIVLSVVAVGVTWRIGVMAEKSLRNATTIGQSGVSQILRYLERRERPSEDEAQELGADIWTCAATPDPIPYGSAVTLTLEVFSTSQGPRYFTAEDSGRVRCTVTMPSGTRVFANAAPLRDEGHQCLWEIAFPANFHDNRKGPLGDTNTAGIYLAEWDGLFGDQKRTTIFTVLPPPLSLRDLLLLS